MEVEKMVFLKVTFTEEEFDLLLDRMKGGDVESISGYIHDTVIKAARRWLKRGKKGTPE